MEPNLIPPVEFKEKSRILEVGMLVAFGTLFSFIGILLAGLTYFHFGGPDEWTSAEKKRALTELIKRAEAQGVVEPTAEQKFTALQEHSAQ